MKHNNRFEWGMAGLGVAAVTACAGVYFYWFRDAPQGGPSEWTDFAEYMGGLSSPVIGIITVILVVLTLKTTRREAHEARIQFERQAVLVDMHRRLEGVLAEWNRLLERTAPDEFQTIWLSVNGGRLSQKSVREIIESNEVLAAIHKKEVSTVEWLRFKHDLVPLLVELETYCRDYESESKSMHLTDFYKSRVKQGLRTLRAADVIPSRTASYLLKDGG